MTRLLIFLTLTTVTATSVALPSEEPSEEPVEEIVVTADFNEPEEMTLAESVSVLTADVISARGAQHLEDIIGAVPNLNFASGTGRTRFFQIRGIGERSQFADPVTPSVGVLVDHIDLSGAATAATLLDVEQVEVLRGPQGTRYGANGLAGLIQIKTHDATENPLARVSATHGSYGQQAATAILNGAISNHVNARIALGKFDSDGFTNNAFLGRNDVNYRDETTLRTKFAVTLSDIHEMDIALSHVDVDNGYDAFSLDNTRITLSDQPGRDRQQTDTLSIDSRWHFPTLDLRVIAAVSRSDLEYAYDEDWTYVGIHEEGYSSTDTYLRQRDNGSIEVRLQSPGADDSSWVAGLYVLDSGEDLTRLYTYLPAPFTSAYDFTSAAAFGRRTTSLGERTEIVTGIRIERRSVEYRDSDGIAFEPDHTMWGGQLALNYQISPSTLLYASLARGYKAGGFNTDGSLDARLREFDPEYLWEWEAGIKTFLAENRVRLRSTLFYDIRRDQQVKSSIVTRRDDDSTEFVDFLGNAAEGTNLGVEVQIDWYASEQIRLFANVGLLSAEFDEFINEFGQDLSGRDQAQAPSWTASFGVDIERGPIFGTLTFDGKDEFYFSDRHDLRSEHYLIANLRAGYQHDHWRLTFWARNLNDEDIHVRGFGSFGNDPRKGWIVEPYLQFGEPRVFGLTFDYLLEGAP